MGYTLGYGAIGSMVKFKREDVTRWDGSYEYYLTFWLLCRNPAIDRILILAPSDYDRASLEDKVEVDPYEKLVYIPFPKDDPEIRKEEPVAFRRMYLDPFAKKVMSYDPDYCLFYLSAYLASTVVPGSIRKVRENKTKYKHDFVNHLQSNYRYCAPQVHFLNKWLGPWCALLPDPRYSPAYKKSFQDCWNLPRRILSQYGENYTINHVPAYEELGKGERVVEEVKAVYSGIEKITSIFVEPIPLEEKKPDSFAVVAMQTNGVDRLKDSRYLALKEYVIDNLPPTPIYGKWGEEVVASAPDYFEGFLPVEELDERMRKVKATLVIPLMEGWASAKYMELVNLGVIPFLHPSYDTQGHVIHPKHYIRVRSPRELREKLLAIESTEFRLELLKDLRDRFYNFEEKVNPFIFYDILNRFTPLKLPLSFEERSPVIRTGTQVDLFG